MKPGLQVLALHSALQRAANFQTEKRQALQERPSPVCGELTPARNVAVVRSEELQRGFPSETIGLEMRIACGLRRQSHRGDAGTISDPDQISEPLSVATRVSVS